MAAGRRWQAWKGLRYERSRVVLKRALTRLRRVLTVREAKFKIRFAPADWIERGGRRGSEYVPRQALAQLIRVGAGDG